MVSNNICVYVWEMQKNLQDFGDLDPILKVKGGQRMMKNVLSATHLLNGWMNFKGILQIVQWEMEKN